MTHIYKLQTLQNQATRMITNAQWYVRNEYIARDLGLKSIPEFIQKLAINFFHKIDNHENEAINLETNAN